jgi:hypothetical protein
MDNRDNCVMFTGPTGSGKTTRLLQTYKDLLESGIQSDIIQVFVLNQRQVKYWKEHLALERSGFLYIDTYFSFVQRELSRFWHTIETHLTEGTPVLEPVFLSIETAQYMMELCIEEMREQGRFQDERFRSQPARMALQLTETLQMAAISRLDTRDIAERLKGAWEGEGTPLALYDDVQATLDLYKRRCLASRLLDYALSLELYNTVLLTNPLYQRILQESVRHVLVDDTEEILPAALECILLLIPQVKTAYFAFCTDGGHSIFFGAHPELAQEKLAPLCTTVRLEESYTSALSVSSWGEALAAKVTGDDAQAVFGGVVVEHIAEDLRGQMIRKVGESLLTRIREGVHPNDIVVVAPFVDQVLEFTLAQALRKEGYTVENLTQSRRLIDIPFSRALVTLTVMLHPQWNMSVSVSDVAQLIALLLELDPIRSMTLAEHVMAKGWINVYGMELRSRIGYAAAMRYNFICQHIQSLPTDIPIGDFIQQIFSRLLYPLHPTEADIAGCRHLFVSARHFHEFSKTVFSSEETGRHFVQMIRKGTIAADALAEGETNPLAVYLTTAYALLMQKGSTYPYQYWLDVSRDAWYRSDAKELTNPHVLSQRWQEGQIWTDHLNDQLRRRKTARIVRALARRCRSGVVVAESVCDSYGSEREGELASHIIDLIAVKENVL